MPQIAQVVKSTFRINHIGGNCPYTLSNTTARGDFALTEKDKEKALQLPQSSHLPYDAAHALILCSSYSYTLGLMLL